MFELFVMNHVKLIANKDISQSADDSDIFNKINNQIMVSK